MAASFPTNFRACPQASNAQVAKLAPDSKSPKWPVPQPELDCESFAAILDKTTSKSIMSTPSYELFDAKLLAEIKTGHDTFKTLAALLHEEAKPLATSRNEEFRVVDRRLQAMRKKGLLECYRDGRNTRWRLVARTDASAGARQ